jgi:hypothetical protein
LKIEFVHSEDVLDFLREEIRLDLRGQDLDREDRWLLVVARNDHGAVIGAMVFEWKTPFDAHLSIAVVDRRCLLLSKLQKLVWETVFERTVRVTMMVDAADERMEHTCRKLGAVYEGFLRHGLDGDRDALVFGMLREDCRWLRRAPAPPQAPQNEFYEGMRVH